MGDISRSSFSSDSEITSVFHDVDSDCGEGSRPNSPSATSIAVSDKAAETLGGTPVKTVSPATGPNAQLKLDIRAHSVAVREAHNQAIVQQSLDRAQANRAEQAWQATPFYHFGDRLKLYNASAKAQIKFSTSTSFVRLEKMHVDYLETLSKSDLSPEEQHAAYSKFKGALADAQQKRTHADDLEGYAVGASSSLRKWAAPRNTAAKTAAVKAEREVQQLLNQIQHPHTASRHNVAQVLQYREQQLHHSPPNSPEASKLKTEIEEIKSFVRAGGLNALSSQEAANLNKLVSTAAAHYKTFQNESAAYKQSTSSAPSVTTLHQAEQNFKTADAAVMDEIRRLKSQGPPQLKKELISHLKHKEFLKASAGETPTARLDDDIATLTSFLNSPQFAALDSTSAQSLTRLIQDSSQKYGVLQQLEQIAKRLEAEADKTAKEAEAKTAAAIPAATSPSTDSSTTSSTASNAPDPAKTPEGEAKENKEKAAQETIQAAKEAARDAAKAAADEAATAAKEARARADAAKIALEEGDRKAMDSIRDLLNPPPPAGISSVASTIPTARATAPDPVKQMASLLKFVRAEVARITSSLSIAPESRQTALKKQLESLQQFLTSGPDEASPEKVNALFELMTKIQEKNKLNATASEETSAELKEETDVLKSQFIVVIETPEG